MNRTVGIILGLIMLLGFSYAASAPEAPAAGTSGVCTYPVKNLGKLTVRCNTKRQYRAHMKCYKDYWWGRVTIDRWGDAVRNNAPSTAWCNSGGWYANVWRVVIYVP